MFAKFESARNGGTMVRIEGRQVAFPERNGPQPKPGEVWEVKVVGKNEKGTVAFLRLINGPLHLLNVQLHYGTLIRTASGTGHLVGEHRGEYALIQNYEWRGGKVRRSFTCVQLAYDGKVLAQVGTIPSQQCTSDGTTLSYERADLSQFHNVNPTEMWEKEQEKEKAFKKRQAERANARAHWAPLLPDSVEFEGIANNGTVLEVRSRSNRSKTRIIWGINKKSLGDIRQEISEWEYAN